MKKENISSLCGLIIILSVFLFACKSGDKLQKELQKVAESINKDCPMQNDAFTRIDGCDVLPNRTLKYNYTFLFTVNQPDTLTFKEKVKETLLYNIQMSASMRYFKDNHVNFIYSYKDEAGNRWGDVLITKDDYERPAVKPEQTNIIDIAQANNTGSNILEMIVQQVKKTLPINFGEANMTVVDCGIVSENTLQYTYQMYTEIASKFDSIQYKNQIHSQLLESLKSEPLVETMFEKGIFIRYVYLDKDDNYLCSITISPNEYRKEHSNIENKKVK